MEERTEEKVPWAFCTGLPGLRTGKVAIVASVYCLSLIQPFALLSHALISWFWKDFLIVDRKFSKKEEIPVLWWRYWPLIILTKPSVFLSCSLFLFLTFTVFLKSSGKNMNYLVRKTEFKFLLSYSQHCDFGQVTCSSVKHMIVHGLTCRRSLGAMPTWHGVYRTSGRWGHWRWGREGLARGGSHLWSWASNPEVNKKISYTCWAPTASEYSTFCVLTNLNFAAILGGKCYHYSYFTDYKIH